MKSPIYLAIGSNMAGTWGPPEAAINHALNELGASGLKITAISRRYGTAALGPGCQSDYSNWAIEARTSLSPRVLLKRLKAIERRAGRNRYSARWTARPLDIDIIDYGGRCLGRRSGRSPAIGSLVIPHPHMDRRPFVVIPLAEIAPHWRHPRTGQSIALLRRRVERQSAGRILVTHPK